MLERSVLDLIEPGRAVSIEHDVFPELVGEGLFALPLSGYWLDVGTPGRYLEATWDISREGRTEVEPATPGLLVDPTAEVDEGASVGPRAVVSAGCRIESGARDQGVGPAAGLRGRRRGDRARLDPLTGGAGRPGARLEGAVVGEVKRYPRMLDDILAMPDHLRDALWRIESAQLRAEPGAGVFACGMGGSAIGADLAAAALAERVTRPLQTVRGYGLPSWATPGWSVLCCSYSGDTEETIACFAAAEALGARRLVASTGGLLTEQARTAGVPVVGLPGTLQPRAAVAYMFAIAAEAAALAEAPRASAPRSMARRPTSRPPARACRPSPPRSPGGSRARCR